MGHPNGQYPSSALKSIPNGQLAKDNGAADSWLAMRTYIGNKTGVWIQPLGPDSSYRTYAKQEHYYNLYLSGQGNPAAKPGTSNHGHGNAVDCSSTSAADMIRKYGTQFGWSCTEGDAVGEWWHRTYIGGYKPSAAPAPDPTPTLRKGDTGDTVKTAQRKLKEQGRKVTVDGVYGSDTANAVGRQYQAYGMESQQHLGPNGWATLNGNHEWSVLLNGERGYAADLQYERRIAQRNGGWDKVAPSHLDNAKKYKAWLTEQRKAIWRAAESEKDGWEKCNRRPRYTILHGLTT